MRIIEITVVSGPQCQRKAEEEGDEGDAAAPAEYFREFCGTHGTLPGSLSRGGGKCAFATSRLVPGRNTAWSNSG